MSIRWDPLVAAAIARELSRRLAGSRVRALFLDSDARRLLLFLREHTLVFELHPLSGWLSLLPARDPFPDARRVPVTIRSVEALSDESALVLALPRVRGRDEGLELVLEMVGNRWNAVVVGHRSRVIRHVLLPREDRFRTLAVGSEYRPPPSTGRQGADRQLSRHAWDEILAGAGDDPQERARALLRGVAWTSSLNVGALVGSEGWERWRDMTDPARWGAFLLDTARGPQPYPSEVVGTDSEACPSLLAAFRIAREAGDPPGSTEALLLPSGLLERGERRLAQAKRRLAGLERELARAKDPEPIRATGDLILARLAGIPRGASEAVLDGFEGDPVTVELDPSLPPHENAARYYAEAARLERVRDQLPARIRSARKEVERWTALVEGTRSGTTPPDRLADAVGSPGPGGGRGKAGQAPSLPYRRFESSGGLEIRVGRGASRNDALTFQHASPSDVWLHARQAAGAHVILRWDREESPPRRDLVEAATLAALHSEARHAGSVPVDWTRRRYVRKPRKSAPGAVIPQRVQTLFVEPDPGLPDRLSPGRIPS